MKSRSRLPSEPRAGSCPRACLVRAYVVSVAHGLCAAGIALAFALQLVIPPSAFAASFTRQFRVPDPVWDFTTPREAVRDDDGSIWVIDDDRGRLINLLPDGHEVVSVGGRGTSDGLFTSVQGLALGPDGLVYVADTSGRLQRFAKDGTFVGKVQIENLTPTYAPWYTGIAFDAAGSVYVSDHWMGSVQKLGPDGSTEVSFAGVSSADDIVVTGDGTVYVVDSRAKDIAVFDSAGTPMRRMPVPRIFGAETSSEEPSGLALDPDGTLVVAVSGGLLRMTTMGAYVETIYKDPGATGPSLPVAGGVSVDEHGGILWTHARWKLGIFSPEGTLLGLYRAVDMGVFEAPNSFAFFGDTTFVTDAQPLLHRLSSSGEVLDAWPLPDGGEFRPKKGAVAVDTSGIAYVTDPDFEEVWKYGPDGTFLGSFFSEWGIGPGIGFGLDGSLFVASSSNAVHRFASGETTPSFSWRSIWPSVVNFNHSQPLAITPEGDVLIAQAWTYQCDEVVRRFTADGIHIRDFRTGKEESGQLWYVTSIACDAEGRIFVGDYWSGRIYWFSPEGEFWGEFSGTKHTPFSRVRALGFDPSGRLWVADQDAVSVFEVSGIVPPSVEVTPTDPAFEESSTAEVQSTPGQENLILVQTSTDGTEWDTRSTTYAPPSGRVAVPGLRFGQTTHVRVLERSPRGDRVTAYSKQVTRVPTALLSTPQVTEEALLGATLTLRGTIRPAYPNGSKPVQFHYWRLESGRWKWQGSFPAQATAMGSYSKVIASFRPPTKGTWRVRAYHPADEKSDEIWSAGYAYLTVKSKPRVGTPMAPSEVRQNARFRVSGSLWPRHRAGTYPVRIYRWKKLSSGRWKSYGYVRAWASDPQGGSAYASRLRLARRGTWRLRAFAVPDTSHVGRWSSRYDYVRVR